MTARPHVTDLQLEPEDNTRLGNLCGNLDENLRLVEVRLGVEINNRGHPLRFIGDEAMTRSAAEVIRQMYGEAGSGPVEPSRMAMVLQAVGQGAPITDTEEDGDARLAEVRTPRQNVRARGQNQQRYVRSFEENDLCFGIGPAGTGKTYLAVAAAVAALESERVRRLILVRPAVEAGERLGFLPGDMAQKIDPYLRPLFDALYEMLGFDRVTRLMEKSIIEVAPLAFMRGRTLNESFIILDEAQNTTVEQMKMFLTRIGFGSTAVVTGDVTQIDLPRNVASGLRQVVEVLKDVEGISFTFFNQQDVVRHPLVRRIVAAYERADRDGQSGPGKPPKPGAGGS